ncbi:MAG: right-handed parallel beta-helix repeat-containing protein [Chloroflexi bacterium]|nr:right-handed parallel beta-helix repeat-containing protein [Chloroflexota bacterium]
MMKRLLAGLLALALTACAGNVPSPLPTRAANAATEPVASPTVARAATELSPTPTKRQPVLIGTVAPDLATPVVNVTRSGEIKHNEIWRGEVHLTGDIRVPKGVTLTIEPGTTVYLAAFQDDQHQGGEYHDEHVDKVNDPVRLTDWSADAITILGMQGTIIAVGTPEQPIVFRPEGDDDSPAQWEGITLGRGAVKYAKIYYAGRTAVQLNGSTADVEVAYNEIRYFHWVGIDSHKTNVWIHDNVLEGGGHQSISAHENNIVEHNLIYNAETGISTESDGAIVRNNIIVDCARGMELRYGERLQIANNTIAWINGPPEGWYFQGQRIYTPFEQGGGIENYRQNASGTVIVNNLIFGSFDWGIGLHKDLEAEARVDYNLMWGQATLYAGKGQTQAGQNNFSANPLFVDAAHGDFHLRSGSPAIDAGDPSVLDADGSRSDLGAYGGPQGAGW